MLSTINLIGRPTRDPEQTSTKSGIRYIKIDVAVNKGYGEKEHVNFYSCWLKEDIGDRLIKAGVKKGSLISIIGDLDVKSYTKNDGTVGTSLNVNVMDWCYVSSGKAKTDGTGTSQAGVAATGAATVTNAPAQNPPQYNPYVNGNQQSAPQFEMVSDDDELPF